MEKIKTRAYINIALIKYWGKKDEYFNLPYQSSLSYTLDSYYTECEIKFSKDQENHLFIDNKKADKKALKQFKTWIEKVKSIYQIEENFIFKTYNFVPYASGLASSASAYAAMSVALNEILNLNLSKSEISKIARLGSGSATRSIYGGFVLWDKGCEHKNSYARKININWPEFTMLVIPTTLKSKKISSRDAMKKSVKHPYYKNFVEQSHKDLEEIIIALTNKDINRLGQIAESNAIMMHKLINLTNINYFNTETYNIIEKVKHLRTKNIPVYYTIDAGPHIKLITLKKYENTIINEFKNYKIITSNEGEDAFVKS